jgi:hypothetical protein
MSTAWMSPVVLRREPWRAFGSRILGRAVVPVVALWLSGVPGTPWTGVIEWLWLRIPVFAIGFVAVILWLFAIFNVFLNKRVLLRCMPTGSIERPRSIQERVLKIPQEFVIGPVITVTPEHGQFMSQSEPRVSLTAAEGKVCRVPLWGTTAEDFVAETNILLQGRKVRFVLVEREALGDPCDEAKADDA